MDLLHTDPRIGVDDRGDIDPIGPGLGDKGVRLQLVEQLLPLLCEGLHLIGRDRRSQGLIGGV